MAEAENKSAIPVHKITFNMKIPKISQLDTVDSPTFLIQDTPWRINVEKSIKETVESLAVYLHCDNEDESNDWTYAASVSVKLLSWNKNTPDLAKACSSNTYDNSGYGYGSSSLMVWDELFSKKNNYVRNDTINLEINIEVADPHDEQKSKMECEKVDQSCEMGCVTNLRFRVINFQNLIAVRSPQFTIYKSDCYLTVFKNDLNQIGIAMQNHDDSEIKCKAKVSVKILSSKIDAKTIVRSKEFDCFDMDVASLHELEKPENGFINNDAISMEVKIKVGCCQFDNAPDTLQDEVKLKLECAICLQTINSKDISSTPCGHLFCTPCVTDTMKINQFCPLCKNVITLDTLRRIYLPTPPAAIE